MLTAVAVSHSPIAVGRCKFGVAFDRLAKVINGAVKFTRYCVDMAAIKIIDCVIRCQSDGSVKVLYRLGILFQFIVNGAPRVVGSCIFGINSNGLIKITQGMLVLLFFYGVPAHGFDTSKRTKI